MSDGPNLVPKDWKSKPVWDTAHACLRSAAVKYAPDYPGPVDVLLMEMPLHWAETAEQRMLLLAAQFTFDADKYDAGEKAFALAKEFLMDLARAEQPPTVPWMVVVEQTVVARAETEIYAATADEACEKALQQAPQLGYDDHTDRYKVIGCARKNNEDV